VFDLELLSRLEEARLGSPATKDIFLDRALADRRFARIFREAQLNMDLGPAEEVGKHIARTTVALELAALLDDWAMWRQSLQPKEEARWKHLLDVARAADPDGWQTQLRDALRRDDRAALRRLASSETAMQLIAKDELLSWTLAAVADRLRRAGAVPAAEALLREAQRQHPDGFWNNQDLGRLLLNAKPPRADEAIPFFVAAVALGPQSAGAHYNLGNALYHKRDLNGAIAAYQKALAISCKFADAYVNLGLARMAQHDRAGAIAEFRTVLQIDPDHIGGHVNLGNALADRPVDIRGQVNLGNALAHREDLDGAVKAFQKAIAIDPNCVAAYIGLGICLEDKHDPEGAIKQYRKAIAINPNNSQAHDNLANVLADKGDVDKAITEYKKAITLDPRNAKAHYNRGLVLQQKRDLDGAIKEYRKAIQLETDFVEAHNNLGLALRDKGQLGEAIAACREALRLKPDFAEAHYNIGVALRLKGDGDGAIAAYREALRLKKDYAEAHNNLGVALRDKGDVYGAIAALREAIRLKPDYAMAHNNFGVALREKGKLEEAIAACREAIRLKPDYAEAHNNLGVALRDKGDVDGAIAACREAIRLKPDYAVAHCSLGHLLRDKGQFAEALAYLRRGHELGSKDPRWPHSSAQWVKECERLCERLGEAERKLPAILSGQEPAGDALQRAKYAEVCQMRHLYAAAARLYREALTAKPDLVAWPVNGIRYNAACAAALAGCGKGEAVAKLTDAERAALRQQALEWLRADLELWQRQLDAGADQSCRLVQKTMQHWLRDADFKGVRGAEALAKLPEAEREPWRALWADVAATLARAQERSRAEEKASSAQAPKQD
jgi:tetratricopeptide (TPR) repeat protein